MIYVILYYITTHRYSYFGQPFALIWWICLWNVKEDQQCHNMSAPRYPTSKMNACISLFSGWLQLLSPLSCSYLLFVKRECFCSCHPWHKPVRWSSIVSTLQKKNYLWALIRWKKQMLSHKCAHTWSRQLSCVIHFIERAVWHSVSMCWEVMDRTWPPPAPIALC